MDSLGCSLNRDQTTTRTTRCSSKSFDTTSENIICKCPNRLNHNSYVYNIENYTNLNDNMGLSGNNVRSNIPKYIRKFGGLHYTQFCVLILVACITVTQSAPASTRAHHLHQVRHRREDPYHQTEWKRQCMPQNMSKNYTNFSSKQMEVIFDIIVSECVTALQNAENHASKFVTIRWKSNSTASPKTVKTIHECWIHEDGAWLHPGRNKQFSYKEPIPNEIKDTIIRQLQNLNREDSERLLIDLYERFLRIEDGIQRIIADHEKDDRYNDTLKYELTHIYDKLKQDIHVILCEIYEGILLLNLTPEKPEMFHAESLVDPAKRIVRDWVIYREYMNLLNFTSNVYNTRV